MTGSLIATFARRRTPSTGRRPPRFLAGLGGSPRNAYAAWLTHSGIAVDPDAQPTTARPATGPGDHRAP
jgi:hypothetical protein